MAAFTGSIAENFYATTFAITVSPYTCLQKWHECPLESGRPFTHGQLKSLYFPVSAGLAA
jgi:hypothetical protein